MRTAIPPLAYADGNLLFGHHGERGALYRVGTVSYPFLSDRLKIEWFDRLRLFAYAVEADFSLYRVYREHAADWGDPRNQESWREPEVYLSVRLLQEPQGIGQAVTRTAQRLRFEGERLLRQSSRIGMKEIESLRAEEERVRQNIASSLPIRAATVRELQWLLGRASTFEEPRIDGLWAPVAIQTDAGYEPLKTSFLRFMAPPKETERLLTFDDHVQCFLALGSLPEYAEFPKGAEFLSAQLEEVTFPVDAVMHVRYVPNNAARSKVKRKTRDADVSYSEEVQTEHGAIDDEGAEARLKARALAKSLKDTSAPPLLQTTMSLRLKAPDKDELERRVDRLRRVYGTVELHWPSHLQAPLYNDHFPRVDAGTVHAYDDYLTVEQFAALMPLATHEAGSSNGPYIGRTSAGRRPVRHDPSDAPRRKRTAVELFAGGLGSGKTIAGETIAIHSARAGSRVVNVDPKPDHMLELVPELEGMVQVIDLDGTDERYQGILDPLIVAPPELREDLAHSYLMDLMPHAPASWDTHVLRALREVIRGSDPGCLRVVDKLMKGDEESKAVGEALGVRSEGGLARLGFGPHPSKPLQINSPVTTIRPSGLSLPDPDVLRGDYDRMELLSVATLKLVAAFSWRLLRGDRSVHKELMFDEAWFLLASRDGRRLIDRLALQGRALNATLRLLTQRLVHVGDVENLAGIRFMFGQESDHDARLALELIGLDPEDVDLVRKMRGYREGWCLYRDLDGRVAEMRFDPGEELLAILDTTPKAVM